MFVVALFAFLLSEFEAPERPAGQTRLSGAETESRKAENAQTADKTERTMELVSDVGFSVFFCLLHVLLFGFLSSSLWSDQPVRPGSQEPRQKAEKQTKQTHQKNQKSRKANGARQ